MAHSAATRLADSDQSTGPLASADHVLNARVELYASLQLLADRARFITGASWAAIALNENNELVYCAAAGSSDPVIGTTLDVRNLRPEQPFGPDKKSLLVRIIREAKTAGFFQLVSNHEFRDQDLQSIVRLAEMVGTAIDCMDAETQLMPEHSQPSIPMAVAPSPKPAVPVLWHAPAAAVGSSSSAKASAASGSEVSVYACESCGFPVSRGRAICFDCEDRGISNAADMARLFATRQTEESWLSAHGYTIASILVSALVAAIIYWLR